MILCISVLSVVISPFSFLILLIWFFSLFFLMSLDNGLSILFIFSKNQLLALLIFAVVSFVSFSCISALIFMIYFLLLTLVFFISTFSSCFKCRVRLFIWFFSLCFLLSLANGLSILFILSKKQLLALLIFAVVSFVSFAFISTLIFKISFLLLTPGVLHFFLF